MKHRAGCNDTQVPGGTEELLEQESTRYRRHCAAGGFTRGTPDNSWTDGSDPWTPPLIPLLPLLVKITLHQSYILVRHEQFTSVIEPCIPCPVMTLQPSPEFNAAPLIGLASVGYDTVPATASRYSPRGS
jgi:hypothetical protein